MLDVGKKIREQKILREYREGLFSEPKLRNLFLELTLRCNENCLHCGSRCGEVSSDELSVEVYKEFLTKVRDDFGTDGKMLCITGGEPLLRRDFFEIMNFAGSLGFHWGMTSNGTLIDRECAHKLKLAGMGTISISIDGLKETHDEFRRTPGGYDKAMMGIRNLIDEGGFKEIQVTTVVTHKSICELDALYEIFDDMDIDSWRIIGIEPIGRATEHPELILTPEDQKYLMEFIRNKRIAGEPVCYGCSHYLGLEYEHEVRDWYFLCTAGIYTAGITVNGDIVSCLDIERLPETVQGNILKDDFTNVWREGFKIFRRNLSDLDPKCQKCPDRDNCHGGAFHSFDLKENNQRVCLKGILW